MAKKRWWKRKKPEQKEKIETLKDVEAILEFLDEVNADVKHLKQDFEKLQELEKERKVTQKEIIQINLESQAEVLDNLLEHYEYFQNDVDINGLRLKAISEQFLRNAKQHGMKDLVKEKKKDKKWKFFW